MARSKRMKKDDDLISDEIQEDFLEEAIVGDMSDDSESSPIDDSDDWDDDQPAGQLALDVYETPRRLIVKARVAGVDKDDLDVSITGGTLTITGTLSSGDEVDTENFHIQECYWGSFSRIVDLPVEVKEDEVDAVLKDGVLTIGFNKIKQQTVKKIHINN